MGILKLTCGEKIAASNCLTNWKTIRKGVDSFPLLVARTLFQIGSKEMLLILLKFIELLLVVEF